MKQGLFIVMEGIDGAGKTTQVDLLAGRLQQEGREVLVTREPGGTRVGKQIREMLLDPGNGEMSPRAESFLYAADRAQHVEEKIRPALQQGKIVICDRFIDSTLAYQGGGRGMDVHFLNTVNELAVAQLYPDAVFILDVPPETGVARRGKNNAADRLEGEGIAFYRRVRDKYLERAAKLPGQYAVIDGSRPAGTVHRMVWECLEGMLK